MGGQKENSSSLAVRWQRVTTPSSTSCGGVLESPVLVPGVRTQGATIKVSYPCPNFSPLSGPKHMLRGIPNGALPQKEVCMKAMRAAGQQEGGGLLDPQATGTVQPHGHRVPLSSINMDTDVPKQLSCQRQGKGFIFGPKHPHLFFSILSTKECVAPRNKRWMSGSGV